LSVADWAITATSCRPRLSSSAIIGFILSQVPGRNGPLSARDFKCIWNDLQ
jgi:hypothetical protein